MARGRQVFMGLRAYDPMRAKELEPLVFTSRHRLARRDGRRQAIEHLRARSVGRPHGRRRDHRAGSDEAGRPRRPGHGPSDAAAIDARAPQAIPQPSLDLSSPEVHIEPKLVQAADMRINTTDLGFTVNALIDGAYVSDYYLDGKKIDLTVMGEERFAKTTQDIEALPIATPMGQLVPLSAVADVELSSGPEQINHRERERAITIQVTPPADVPLEDAMLTDSETRSCSRSSPAGQLDGGYHINLAGTADKLRETWRALRFNILLACVITYLLMAALFESWLYPFVIILTVPLGAVGGMLGSVAAQLLRAADARRADDARLRDPHRHGREQSDSDRAPVAQPHARRRHVAQRRDRRIGPHAHAADLHDRRDDGARPVAAGAVSRRRQRAVSRPGRGAARRPDRFDRLHAGLDPRAVQPDDGRAAWFMRLVFGEPSTPTRASDRPVDRSSPPPRDREAGRSRS